MYIGAGKQIPLPSRLPIHEPGGAIEQIITNIPESEQTFEFVTYDALGNKSVSTFKNTTSYGSRYQESLLNRRIINSVLNSTLQTAISPW